MGGSARAYAARGTRLRIGVDFDNTIVRYDRVFTEIAREAGLIPADFCGSKTVLRDYLRAREGGEWEWTTIQARAYGPGLVRAEPFDGALAFFAAARERGLALTIVSHKTEFAVADPSGVNLRSAAATWLAAQGFSSAETPVYFESTRDEKIARIAHLGCTHFIDDLEEVFADPAFPPGVRRLLFVPDPSLAPRGDFEIVRSWNAITSAILG